MSDGHDTRDNCPICRQRKPICEIIPGSVLNGVVLDAIQRLKGDWTEEDAICSECLANAVKQQAAAAEDPVEVDDAVQEQGIVEIMTRRRFGERVADNVASFVGSWTFLVAQFIFLFFWIIFNSIVIFRYRFDPYPFIFLNLVLSWAAALQAPLVLMSQNRQDARDRYRDENEYRTNVVAEGEIRQLHLKIDQFLGDYLPLLADVHQRQLDLMSRLTERYQHGDES